MSRLPLIVLMAVLAGCGSRGTLTQAPGQPQPPAPAFAAAPPTPEQMLVIPPEAAPARVDDLIRRPEQERPSDPFDLPPTR